MAEGDDKEQKTEDASSKRLEEAREQGMIPVSREVATWSLFVGILAVVAWIGPRMALQLLTSLRVFLEMPHEISLEGPGLQTALGGVAANVALATLLSFGVLSFAVVAGTMVQNGFFFSLERLKPDFSRVMPSRGLKQLFSITSLAELLKSFIKLVVIGTVVGLVLRPLYVELPNYTEHDLSQVMQFLHHQTIHLIAIILLIVTVIAIADLVFQRAQYYKSLRMSKQEVKDEYKQMEGDPMIKARLRQIRLEKARKRMMAQVPKADVVITNPTHYAIALQYDNSKMAAPVVLAKGVDRVAERIREVADEHKIPLVSNPTLARAIYDTVDVDEPIKPEQYRAVAEVISYVYRLKKKKP